MRAFPFVKQVAPVNLGARIRAGFVRTECARNSCQQHLGWAEINRIFPARNPDVILVTSHLSIGCFAIEENAVVAWIAKRKSAAAASVLRGETDLGVPRRRQRTGNVCSDPTYSVGTEYATVHQRII